MTRLGTANSASDVIIVGAGIVGCTIALRLAKAGLSVTVLERSVPGAEASRVAAGILGPAIEASAPGVALDLVSPLRRDARGVRHAGGGSA